MIEILYADDDIAVCIKPPRVLSTDEPGGVPELVRQALGRADVRTVHRLDRVVSGLMVLALNATAASELSRQIRENTFQKEYLAVIHGVPGEPEGDWEDLLLRDKARKMTFVVPQMAKGVQNALLHYQTLRSNCQLTRVRIQLQTGRTHQIRVQFASRGLPLVGERKYATLDDTCQTALWSYRLAFRHPASAEELEFIKEPPAQYPWTEV